MPDTEAAPGSAGGRSRRGRLDRGRVLERALTIADEGGLDSLTMRSLARDLDVRPMAVYHYFANKDEILDGIIDAVFDEMDPASTQGDWRSQARRSARSTRRALARHPWVVALLESRVAPGRATLRHHDAMVGALLGAGLSARAAAHAHAVLDSYVYGFAVRESVLPFVGTRTGDADASAAVGLLAQDDYPHLARLAAEHLLRPDYDADDEFELGLDLLLDALGAALADA